MIYAQLDSLAQTCAACGRDHNLTISVDTPLQGKRKKPLPYIRVFYLCGTCTRTQLDIAPDAEGDPPTFEEVKGFLDYLRYEQRSKRAHVRGDFR